MACTKTSNNKDRDLRTGEVFFDDSSQVLWRHRVNASDELLKYAKYFKGVELDVFFYSENNIEVEHDHDSTTHLELMDYFAVLEHPDSVHYWIDIKNLSKDNALAFAAYLDGVVQKYPIKRNIICESFNPSALKILNKKGYYTSYWIPHFNYSDTLNDKQLKYLNDIKENLKESPHNAISASYKMFPFIKEYLPDCTTHLWTNGLKTEKDMKTIKEFESYPFVKVILVDYEKPF